MIYCKEDQKAKPERWDQ